MQKVNAPINAPLAKPLRAQLENTVKAARDLAEKAASAALAQLAVAEVKAPEYLDEDAKALRRRLRAHARALGDTKRKDYTHELRHLVWEAAYEHWHRMLFARFLAENGLLMWELGASVSLDDCRDIVDNHPELALGAKSHWDLAGKLAARMLPQVFQPQSPVFELTFAPEHQRDLEKLLIGLAGEVFKASDSLGWVYQFWQAKRKDEVNASEVKIGADELPAVTQLFTEPYMVDFLLHNSLGAWWVTQHPGQARPVELSYLRTLEDGTPAAGGFERWPDSLAGFKLLDPCCGSGHFLVAAFLVLVPMRMAAEGLSARVAVDAVLADNLYGLELDPRCVEIAVFALALTAWRYPDEGGNPLGVRPEMPAPNIACCGLKVAASAKDWEALVPDSQANAALLRQELRLLHSTFAQAPLLGSLLDPAKSFKDDLATSSFDTLKALLERALATEMPATLWGDGNALDDDAWDLALTARGLLDAARLLDGRYHLVITNVPYLARGKQSDELKHYCAVHYPEAKNDLANVFLERCLELARPKGQGVVQIVMPQNWLFLSRYESQRRKSLVTVTWNLIAKLGYGAFQTPLNAAPILLTQTQVHPLQHQVIRGIDVYAGNLESPVNAALISAPIATALQSEQLVKPSAIIDFSENSNYPLLADFGYAYQGIKTSDDSQFVFCFWEQEHAGASWEYYQTTVDEDQDYAGRHLRILFESGNGRLRALAANQERDRRRDMQGINAWGRRGVAVSLMGDLPATIYSGDKFDANVCALIPKLSSDIAALWCFCCSAEFKESIRSIDQSLKVANGTVVKIPFDADKWRAIASAKYHEGLPAPQSHCANQWLFHGHPKCATDPLLVAVARLLGYRWPAESDHTMDLSDEARTWISRCDALVTYVDDDGIVCLPSVRGERPASERLLSLLIESWETVEAGSWRSGTLDKLLADSDGAGKSLDVWLREKFFEQHAKFFHHRPFIWHVWDGLRDGFGALVNYHKLDAKNLERLIHTYLGDWIRQQEAGVATGTDGAPRRLAAAQLLKNKLEAILEGEAPYDIFVRWKPLSEQTIGWNPDLNDGVRLNIRPFMTAEVLRYNKKPKLNITWDKDRGKDVESAPWFHKFKGERINDHHLTLADKRAARDPG